MRRTGLQGVPQRRRWRKKPAGVRPAGTQNHLNRDFSATAPNTKWVTDITYIRTAEHWLYLCVVLDLYSGLVVGWSMSPQQDRQLVVHAVLMALWQRPARTPVILHSDRGCQFTSEEYQRFLAAHHVTCSMSAVGSCADNAAAESFFGVLKRERVNRQHYQIRAEARADIFDYIKRSHNPRQRRRLELQQQGERLLTQPSVKMGENPHVPLSEEAKAILRSFDSFLRSAWVFPGLKEVTQPMDSRAFLRRSFEPGLRQAGITGACWHSLRHTAASRRVMAGVDLVSVKEILGHRDIQTTLQYAHLAPGHLRDAVNRGSLSGTVTKTVTSQEGKRGGEMQPLDSVVRPEGLEPPTPRSVVWCSIH